MIIRGERPVMDLKFDILKHPSVRLTTDGEADPYIHGEPWDAGYSIELVYDPEVIKAISENVEEIDLPETDLVLLSEEDVEKEMTQEASH
jgi:type IV secretion system protein VirD4